MKTLASPINNANARPRHTAFAGGLLCAVITCTVPQFALGDGGALRLSQRHDDLQVSVFTSPENLRVGPVDISVLVQRADSGTCVLEIPALVRLERLDSAGIPLEQPATTAAATNKLFRAAIFDVPQPGRWRATIWVGEEPDPAKFAFDMEIGPPPPPWIELAAWTTWPFFVFGLFIAHQWRKFKINPSL